MDISKFIAENWQLVKSNLVVFITFAFLIFGVAWFFINFFYKKQLQSLRERLSLKDEQIKYYKDLTDAKQTSPIPVTNATLIKANNIREDILREIQFLKQNTGKVLSVQLFERLQVKYTFLVILSELFAMNKNNELSWAEAPQPPDALSEIRIVE